MVYQRYKVGSLEAGVFRVWQDLHEIIMGLADKVNCESDDALTNSTRLFEKPELFLMYPYYLRIVTPITKVFLSPEEIKFLTISV